MPLKRPFTKGISRGVVPSGGGGGVVASSLILNLSPIAFWKLIEASGTTAADSSGNGRNGTYSSNVSGWTPRTDGVDGQTFPHLDGTRSIDIYSTSLRDAFNGAAGTVFICGRIDEDEWVDATARRLIWLWADNNNLVSITKSATSNFLTLTYRAGSTTKSVNIATSSTDLLRLALTWDKAADEMKVFIDGVQSGSTQTALGTWAGQLASTQTRIGATLATPTDPFVGALGYAAIWSRALSPSEVGVISSSPPF